MSAAGHCGQRYRGRQALRQIDKLQHSAQFLGSTLRGEGQKREEKIGKGKRAGDERKIEESLEKTCKIAGELLYIGRS
jgi:hypothetical protein